MGSCEDQPGIFLTSVVRREALCREHFELTLRADLFPRAAPGQFIQVLAREPDRADVDASSADGLVAGTQTTGPLLRRPFSIARLRHESGGAEIGIIGRVVGAGTAWLDSRRAGDSVGILGPLGRGFTRPGRDAHALLIAGGVGLPPVRWLAEQLAESSVECTFFFGARTRDLIPFSLDGEPSADGFSRYRARGSGFPVVVSTDDGSCGFRGTIADALLKFLADRPGSASRLVACACGPEKMLRAVARITGERSIPCEVALERVMGCGMGTCQSCVVPVADPGRETGRRYALCCTEGPVFDSRKIIW